MHLNEGMKIYKEWIDSIEAQACVREKKNVSCYFRKIFGSYLSNCPTPFMTQH